MAHQKPLSRKQLIQHGLAILKIIYEKDKDLSPTLNPEGDHLNVNFNTSYVGWAVMEPITQYFIRKDITWDLSSGSDNSLKIIIDNN